jgi:hypothetical protein
MNKRVLCVLALLIGVKLHAEQLGYKVYPTEQFSFGGAAEDHANSVYDYGNGKVRVFAVSNSGQFPDGFKTVAPSIAYYHLWAFDLELGGVPTQQQYFVQWSQIKVTRDVPRYYAVNLNNSSFERGESVFPIGTYDRHPYNPSGDTAYIPGIINGRINKQILNAFEALKLVNLIDVCANAEGGFTFLGTTQIDNTARDTVGIVVKVDQSFNIKWKKNYSNPNSRTVSLKKIIQLKDGSFFIGGTYTSDKDGYQYYIYRISSEGEIITGKLLGNSGHDELEDIIETNDGKIICIGSSSESSVIKDRKIQLRHNDAWVVCINKWGNIIWEKTFGGTAPDRVKSINKFKDSFVIAGESASEAYPPYKNSRKYNDYDYWVLLINENGDLIWDASFGGSGFDSCIWAGVSLDGKKVMCIGTSESGASHWTQGNKTLPILGGGANSRRDVWVVNASIVPTGILQVDHGIKKLLNNQINVITTTVIIELENDMLNGHIHYTLDGTDPTFTSQEYNSFGKIGINSTTDLKVKSFSNDYTRSTPVQSARFVKADLKVFTESSHGGSVSVVPLKEAYLPGDRIEFKINENSGWKIDGLFINGQFYPSATLDNYRIQDEITVLPVFKTSIQLNAIGAGVIKSSTGAEYTTGEETVLQAIPDQKNYFLKWAGAVEGEEDFVVLNPAKPNGSYSALFAPLPGNSESLSVFVDGKGTVNITPQKPYYDTGEIVTLTAIPVSDEYVFSEWKGIDSTDSLLKLLIDKSWALEAVFYPKTSQPPTITKIPENGAFLAGEGVILTIEVQSQGSYEVTWFKNGEPIPEWTNETQVTPVLEMSHAGVYRVEVRNSGGKVSSETFKITVKGQPAEIAIDTFAGVIIEGTVGAKYRVEFKDKLDDAAKWIAGDMIALPESPYVWVDRFKPIRETRYYRVVLVE